MNDSWKIKPLTMENERNGIVRHCEEHEAQFFGVYHREDGYWLWQQDLPTYAAAEAYIIEQQVP